jgi:hypothetical protein
VLAALQITFVYAPFMHEPFGAAPLELRHWLVALGGGAVLFAIVEVEKAISRRVANARRDRTRPDLAKAEESRDKVEA